MLRKQSGWLSGLNPERLGYLLNTVRYLRPVQIYGRIWFKIYRPSPTFGPAPEVRSRHGRWVAPARRQQSMYVPATFRFLGESHELSSMRDWNHPLRDKLWLYHLHYFDDLNAQDGERRNAWHRSLIARWIRENPAPGGNGWEPYPLSLRIVNWIKWALAGNALDEIALNSLAVQARYLSRRLEWHLLGNHLFANAKALVFAGVFYSGAEAEEWLEKGCKILRGELQEQVLADGGHFERSPMYHSIILEDLLDIVNLARAYETTQVDQTLLTALTSSVQRMRSWLRTCCHPDGQIAFFNDAAFGMACAPNALHDYALRLGFGDAAQPVRPISHLSNSGYVCLTQGPAYVLMDVGEIGPDYIPGHAHADTLSFELSLSQQRVLVNSGTSCYGASPERLRQRSTPAHNTVTLNGQNSSEVWGGFRVARRARPFGLEVRDLGDRLEMKCAHSGYQRLSGRPVHWRRLVLRARELMVHDWIERPFEKAEAAYHFHPSVRVNAGGDLQSGSVILPDGHDVSWEVLNGHPTIRTSTYHPGFGVSEPSYSLRIGFAGAESRVIFRW